MGVPEQLLGLSILKSTLGATYSILESILEGFAKTTSQSKRMSNARI